MRNVHIGWGPVGMTKIIAKRQPKLKLNVNNIQLEVEETFKIEIISEYTEVPVWSSSNENVAIVNQEGVVTVVGAGVAYITVTSGESKGTCVIRVQGASDEPIIPDDPDEPTSKLDDTKIYYGTIQSPQFMKFSELTEDDVVNAVKSGSLKINDLKIFETEITVANQGDVVLILIPTKVYSSGIIEIDGSKHGYVDSVTGTNFHSNGEVRIRDFYIFRQWMLVPGLLKIYVE